MKTLKTLTIIFGIAIGILGLVSTTVKADGKGKATTSAKAEKAKATIRVYDAEMQETENLLIENYLQMVDYEKVDDSITIVNEAGMTVYKGAKENAADLLKRSDYLFSFGEAAHYLITE